MKASTTLTVQTYWRPCDDHIWEPIYGWSARYRCARCSAIAYRNFVRGVRGEGSSRIVTYTCPKCKGGTSNYKNKRAQRCPNCR